MRRGVLEDKGARMAKVIRMIRILDHSVPADAPTAIIPTTSLRGFKGVRVEGVSSGIPWSVTLYGGNFYLVHVSGTETVTLDTPLHVVNHLRAHLRNRSSINLQDIS